MSIHGVVGLSTCIDSCLFCWMFTQQFMCECVHAHARVSLASVWTKRKHKKNWVVVKNLLWSVLPTKGFIYNYIWPIIIHTSFFLLCRLILPLSWRTHMTCLGERLIKCKINLWMFVKIQGGQGGRKNARVPHATASMWWHHMLRIVFFKLEWKLFQKFQLCYFH